MIVLDCSAAVEMVRGTSRGYGFRCLMLKDEHVVAFALTLKAVVTAARPMAALITLRPGWSEIGRAHV